MTRLGAGSFRASAAQAALRGLWFFVIPALAAAFAVHHLAPRGLAANAPSVARALASTFEHHPVPFALGVFLILTLLIRYWRYYLPGGRYLARVPPAVAERAKRAELAEYSAASELVAWSSRRSVEKRITDGKSSAERAELVAARRTELARAVASNDWAVLPTAYRALVELLGPELRRKEWLSLASLIALVGLAAIAALLLREHVFQPYRVLSGSMLPSLEPGEYVVTAKRAYAALGSSAEPSLPRRGDIVIFNHEGLPGVDELTKRVIGLPGDRISMHAGFPAINGWEVPHCDVGRYLYIAPGQEVNGRLIVEFLEDRAYLTVHVPGARPADDYEVQKGQVFVLGDNRNQSIDSRYWNQGKPRGLPLSAIVGRIDWLLMKPNPDGTSNLSSFLEAPGLELDFPRLDVRSLKEGIQRCLDDRPKQTRPPKPAHR